MSLALSGSVSSQRSPTGVPPAGVPDFASLPPRARLFIATTIALGAAALATSVNLFVPQPWVFVCLLAAAALAALFKVDLPLSYHGMTMSLSFAFEFAALIYVGPQATMIIAAVAGWIQCALRVEQRNPLHRTAFSMAALVLAARGAGWVYAALGGAPLQQAGTGADVESAIVAAAGTYFVLNTVLISAVVSFTTGLPLPRVWNETFVWSALSFFVGAAAAAVGVSTVRSPGAWMAPLLVIPLYLTWRTYGVYRERMEAHRQQVHEISDLHLATLEALALAIDAKDHTSTAHVRRVQVFAAGLARAVGVPEAEVQGVRTAALLHDIGKLAVPEHILSKPGPLTQEEFHKVQAHAAVGAEIVAHVPFPYPVAPLIRSHHERWDGKGYPEGINGEEIPLGARVLALVDHYDGLISDRPFRRALSKEEALADVQREAGAAFDPRVVGCFMDLLPELEAEAERHGEPDRPLSFLTPAGGSLQPDRGPSPVPAASVLENIAQAHREIHVLYEIAQSMGTSLGLADTMALISSKLSSLVPFSTCALFLSDDTGELLRCRFATGVDAEALEQVALRSGEGLVGWVVRNQKTLTNARPGTDFETAGLPVETSLQSALVCPLAFEGRIIGALAVYDETPGRYTDDHRRLLDRVAEQAAGVVHNSVVFEQTKRDSLTDTLTGLPNTRFMRIHLTRELARAERLGAEVSLLVMDLDGFKSINDMYGHHVGDKALREVARVLRHGIRPYDICVRYAGDEFVVVLSGCGALEAEQKKQELQKAIEEIPFEVRPGRFLKLGSSFGYAVFPRDGEAYETLIDTADKRMYQDKAERKSRGGPALPDSAGAKRPSVFAKIPPQPSVKGT